MSVKDNPNKEFEREYNGRQEQGTVLNSPDQVGPQAAKEASKTLPQGAPLTDYTVRSVYDSRPVNGFDFNIFAGVGEAAAVGPVVFRFNIFTVPQNYVAVPRIWHIFFDPLPVVDRDDVLVTLLLDDSEVEFNRGIPVGEQEDDLRSFFTADEFQRVGIIINVTVVTPLIGPRVHVYGNMLQKTGIPSQFQIANLGGKQKPVPLVASTIVPTTLPPEAAAPGTPTAQRPMPTQAQVRGRILHAAGRGYSSGTRRGLGRPKT